MTHDEALKMLKPCPFCGRLPGAITHKTTYEELMDEDGKACISVRCEDCNLVMYEHSNTFPEYEDRLVLMVAKWNRRKA